MKTITEINMDLWPLFTCPPWLKMDVIWNWCVSLRRIFVGRGSSSDSCSSLASTVISTLTQWSWTWVCRVPRSEALSNFMFISPSLVEEFEMVPNFLNDWALWLIMRALIRLKPRPIIFPEERSRPVKGLGPSGNWDVRISSHHIHNSVTSFKSWSMYSKSSEI